MGLLKIHPGENVPLWVDQEHGVVRIPGTRLKLETVICEHYRGCGPQEIVEAFDTLAVETVQSILEWYEGRRDEVDAYMVWSDANADRVRADIQSRIAEFRELKGRQGIRPVQAQPV